MPRGHAAYRGKCDQATQMRVDDPHPIPTPGSGSITLSYRCRGDGIQAVEHISEGVQGLTGFSAEDFLSGDTH